MRPDQYQRLMALDERLMDVFLEEVNPDNWEGSKIPIDQQDSKIRGNRYWHKRNAAATLTLVVKVNSIVGIMQRNMSGDTPGLVVDEHDDKHEDDIDAQINSAERKAAALIKKITDPATKQEFMERTLGKSNS